MRTYRVHVAMTYVFRQPVEIEAENVTELIRKIRKKDFTCDHLDWNGAEFLSARSIETMPVDIIREQ